MDVSKIQKLGLHHRQAFQEDGAVLIESLLSAEQIADCRKAYELGMTNPGPYLQQFEKGSEGRTYNDVANPNVVEVMNGLVRSFPFGELFSALWGSDHVWFLSEEVFAKEGGNIGRTQWHQDLAYLPVIGEHLANVWISFETLPKKNSLEFVVGSHRGPAYNGSMLNPDDPTDPLWDDDRWPRLPNIEAIRQRDPGVLDIVSWAVNPGDVLVFHPGSLHGGAPVDGDCPSRHTLTLRFFGDLAFFRALPSKSRANYRAPHLEHIMNLKEGDPYRSPFYVQLC